MSKNTNKKATLNDFMAKKIKREEDKAKTKDIYVSSMEKTITVIKPSETQYLDYANEIGDGTNLEVNLEASRKLIYNCCADLHNPEVLEMLELKDPYDIARVLFDMEDVKEIMDQFNELISNKKIEEEIKN